MRVGAGGVFHESHSFAVPMTGLSQFTVVRGEEFVRTYRGTRTSMGGVLDAAPADWTLVPILYATATPSGTVTAEAYRQIRDGIVRDVERENLDALILILHGAMSVEGLFDSEGDLIEQVRRVFARPRPVVVTIDLHANLSERLVELADLIDGYKTYPHVDPYDRAVEAVGLMGRIARGEVRPAAHLTKPPILPPVQAQGTERSPMRELIAMAREMETNPRVLNVTVTAGFPYGDEPRVGMGFLVTTDGDADLARRLADQLGDHAWNHRRSFRVENPSPAEAVRAAIDSPEWPVVLVDVADNVGGGSAADGTVLLRELIDQGAPGALVTICDPAAVEAAFAAGASGEFAAAVGGRTDAHHGPPVRVEGKVVRLLSDGRIRYRGSYMTGQPDDMGRSALIRSGGIDLVLTSRRVMPFDVAYLLALDVHPADYRIIVAKSAVAWRSAFGDICRKAIEVDTPGITTIHLERLPYRHLKRPLYPMDLF